MEWQIVNELVTCLENFALATEVLSGDSGSLFSSSVPIIVKLKNDVSHCPQQSSATLLNVTQKLLELIDHYFFGTEFLNIFSPESLLYCLLDP